MGDAKMPLHSVEPREQVGPRTGSLFEYQYHQAAAETLKLLNSDAECIYCEWHDDYVSEDPTGYSFFQVKTRTPTQGLWSFANFFGLSRKTRNKPRQLSDDRSSIFANLWDHTQRLGVGCRKFTFVSDTVLDSELETLLALATSVERLDNLTTDEAKLITELADVLAPGFAGLDKQTLFTFLSKLHFQEALGSLKSLPDCQILIATRILNASEVDLAVSEAKRIGEHLVDKVRDRSHVVLKLLPKTKAELRQVKGLVIDDLLNLLSLSPQGYRELKANGQEAVLALSRLQRLCKANKVAKELIPELCAFKTAWAAWWTDQRELISGIDYAGLKHDCIDLLRAHSAGGLSWQVLAGQSTQLSEKYRDRLTSSVPLTPDLVIGFIISLAVEAA